MVRAFLIGAGATRAQYPQAPLNSDFFVMLNGIYPDIYNRINDILPSHIKDIGLSKMSIEQIMGLSGEFPESIRNSFIQSVYLSIYKLIAETTGSTENHMIEARNRTSIGYPTLFNNLLNEPRLKNEDFFLTLNYDLYLDREIMYHNMSIDYGIPKDKILEHTLQLQFNGSDLSIYHLHGALNWVFAGNNKSELIIHNGAVIPSWSRGNPNLCLVPPGKKDLYPILIQLWKSAEERLMTADELIIIGCSLNPDDEKLIEMISKFVKLKSPKKVKIISSSDNKSENNYYNLIGEGFKLHNHGFKLINTYGYDGAIDFIFRE